ncbi:ABC transporter ATP-binding protein [Aquabacterium sp. J223]|uniref:ABC transporter ATP-binding protein n=1 Tax=Aquabacterium sp. J223 TaxID=2898431 RepID=UPI0021AE125E|nr:ABC transporter ATP-binding protein [Aquabacterium sp. J223]UUX95821.1 ABC transporter ATP-binding protein [Aquabacterium sp. J223]
MTLAAVDLAVALGGRTALHGVSLSLATGWTALVGPNGAGKSTLLRALAGLLPPQAGTVMLDGRPLAQWPAAERARRLAWLAQAGETSGELSVRETVALGRLPHTGLLGDLGPDDTVAVDDALAATACSASAQRPLAALSGGERQRVLIARALATGAPTLLLDEPTTHLDPVHQVAIAGLLRRLAARHSVVTVLHDLNLALRADRLLVLRDGRLLAHGRADDPALHAALVAAFDGALRLHALDGQVVALPALDPAG